MLAVLWLRNKKCHTAHTAVHILIGGYFYTLRLPYWNMRGSSDPLVRIYALAAWLIGLGALVLCGIGRKKQTDEELLAEALRERQAAAAHEQDHSRKLL